VSKYFFVEIKKIFCIYSMPAKDSESARLEKAEMEIQKLLQINCELTARCEFLQQNFNGDYNELLIEYNALNKAFDILKKHKQCV